MRIVFYTTCGANWGGSEILWTKTAKDALQNGHKVAISIFDWENQHESVQELIKLGAKTYLRRPFYPRLSTRIKKKLFNIFLPSGNKYTYCNVLHEFKPDHIFFNLAGGYEIAYDSTDLMVFVKQTKIAFSVFYHSISVNHEFDEITRANFQYVINKSKCSFFTTKWQSNEFERQLFIPISNAIVLHHPLREIHEKKLFKLKNREAQLCIIGSLVNRWKGQDIAIRCLSKHQEKNWHLNIYGDGEDYSILTQLVNSLGLNDRITFHGFENDINKIFLINDLVIIPSRIDSGPIVMFESMLAGLPVVGSNLGAMHDFIVNGDNGVLATGIDEATFDLALEFALLNRDKWQEWGENSRKKMIAEYDFNSSKTLLSIITNVSN